MTPENNFNQVQFLQFDQKPIGQGQKMPEISEYPAGMLSQYIDFNTEDINGENKPEPLPLPKRITSKVWKIRKQAFQQLYQDVENNPNVYQEYLKDTVKLITDANVLCQERALKVFFKFIQNPGQVLEDPKPIIKALIEKCLVIEKGDITNLSTQILFWMMDNYQLVLFNELNEGLLNKNPKICGCVFAFLQKLINNYGIKRLKQLEEFSKNFTVLSTNFKPVAKQQASNMFKEAFKWMDLGVFNLSMQVEVKEEVNKFAKVYVRQQMHIKRGLNEEQKKGKKPLTQSFDDDENEQAQDVLAPFDSRWADKVLDEVKWKQKKALLDQFIKKTRVHTIVPRDNTHFINLIKRLLADNNINLLQCGFKVIKNLSKGLKKNFSHPCKVILSYVFSKLRDTKAMIVDEAQQTLEFMLNCLSIEEFQEDIRDGLKDKAPNMRLQTLKLIEKMLSKKDKKMVVSFKNLTLLIIDLSQDGSSQVRDKALNILCKLKAAYGMNFFGDKLKKIQGKKLQTIENYVDPNDNSIDEQPITQRNDFQLIYDKKSIKTNSPVSRQQNATKQSIISQPNPKISSFNSEFDSPSENVRLLAYQSIHQKSQPIIYQQIVQGFKNRAPMARQSNPSILKIILSLIKKSIPSHSMGTINADQINVLLYHDWKKCKPLISDFIQNNKLNLQALENVKNSGILPQLNGIQSKKTQFDGNSTQQTSFGQPNFNQNALKYFYSSIQSFIPKMSSPDPIIRLQSVQTALQIIKQVPIGAPNDAPLEPSAAVSESLSQLFNILKYRIQDSNEEIANNYINLVTQMLSKGFLTKYKTPGRMLISMLIQNLPNRQLTNLQKFIRQMVDNHAPVLWQFLTVEILKQQMCGLILNIIKVNNQSFFEVADKKAYILPLLTNISKDIETLRCSQLLDQIVEINGEVTLEKVVKDGKISGYAIQNYLNKWNIMMPTQHTSIIDKSKPQASITSSQFLHSKMERLSLQQQNPWPFIPSPTHFLKLITQMMNMGQPFQSLASPTLLLDHELAILLNLNAEIIQDYSDIWTKWIFWRIHIESQPKNLQTIFALICRLINSGFLLHESEIITLLGTIISCLTIHKLVYIKPLIAISSLLNQHPLYRQNSFRFYINSFNDPSAPVDEILYLIVHSCANQIHGEIVTLARYPAVKRNKQFNQYLRANYPQKLLAVYGFKVQEIKNGQKKLIISESLRDDHLLTEVESKYFVELFQRCSSNELINRLINETQDIGQDSLMQNHLKIMHSVIVPYLNRQLSFINVYNYFKFVQKVITAENSDPYLLNIVRTLSFFLIDLDEIKLENHGQMVKTINKLLLMLFQFSESRHILEVLCIIIKQQLKVDGNLRLILLLPKCIGKVIKNSAFKSQYKRSIENTQCLTYVSKEMLEIVNSCEMSPESNFLRTIRVLISDMISIYPHVVTIIQDLISQNREALSEKTFIFVNQIIQDKSKQNVSKNQISLNSSTCSVRDRQIGNMVKGFKCQDESLGQGKV